MGKGKKVVTFDMKHDPPDDDTLLAHLLGPTGNLQAPTLRKGKTLLVGFSEDGYAQAPNGHSGTPGGESARLRLRPRVSYACTAPPNNASGSPRNVPHAAPSSRCAAAPSFRFP